MRIVVAGAAAALVSGCALFSDRSQPVIVTELERIPACSAPGQGPEPKIHYFEAAALVNQWQQRHGIPATPIDAVVDGPFVLIELGEPGPQGNGVLVSRNAVLHSGKRLVLQSTFYGAQSAGPEQPPCVLLALPPRHYKVIELYDQEGALRATTSSIEEVPGNEDKPVLQEAPSPETPAPAEAPTQQETPKEEQNQ
ncbi:MAG TPA: hypothetical protein VFB36_13035 [Nevskiaceae bacterium]|nr:hypothetical protein [Nevskiaceae bacterium]